MRGPPNNAMILPLCRRCRLFPPSRRACSIEASPRRQHIARPLAGHPLAAALLSALLTLLLSASACQHVSAEGDLCGGFIANPPVCRTGLACLGCIPDVPGRCVKPCAVDDDCGL